MPLLPVQGGTQLDQAGRRPVLVARKFAVRVSKPPIGLPAIVASTFEGAPRRSHSCWRSEKRSVPPWASVPM